MSTIHIESAQKAGEVLSLVKSAVESEITRFELAIEAAQNRLAPFEHKYRVTSETFMVEMSAEDLEGGDDEYIRWAGEYQLKQRLQEKLQRLQEIGYRDPRLLQSDQRTD